ncbi:flippase-like domain-containing protein [Dysgonomonas sp. OttesenSCG-928-M03]|nr:flippase-like domain-containing protein [Dysgonomonas sp. OttesenSCG-928-M03]
MDKGSSKISIWKILLPTLLGVGIILYMFSRDLLGEENASKLEELKNIPITGHMVFWIFVALLCMVGRDLGFTIRYRFLTDKLLSWKQSLKVTLLAEFGTAITPSSVGGSTMAVVFLAKENIPVGKSTAMVFTTMLLDEMFFVVTFPIFLFLIPLNDLFPEVSGIEVGIITVFVLAYLVKLLLCICLIIGLFFKPQAIRWLLIKIFKLPFLGRWQASAEKAGNDIITSSKEIRGRGFSYWFPLITATVLSWSSRYLIVNALFMAFFPVTDHLLIFARQFVMWILMILSITPGGSGLSELIFKHYLSSLIPIAGLVPVIIFLWRFLSYYTYLFIGAILVPRWASKAFSKKENN